MTDEVLLSAGRVDDDVEDRHLRQDPRQCHTIAPVQAVVVRKSGALSFEQVDDPVAGPGTVVVELRAAAVNRRGLLVRSPPGPAYQFPDQARAHTERRAAADERSERLHREALARKRAANPGLYAAQKAARPEFHRDRPEPAAEPEPEPARSPGRFPKVLTW
jgi:hypothetical protein